MKIVVVKPSARLSIVVSKKVSPLAVRRNLIKRRLREAINTFSTTPRVTIIALPSIVGKTFQEIKEALKQAIQSL